MSRDYELSPRELNASSHPLASDLRAAEIERRFTAALKAIKANRQFTLDAEARNPSLEYPVRLGVRLT